MPVDFAWVFPISAVIVVFILGCMVWAVWKTDSGAQNNNFGGFDNE
ncbi:hypothetical protein [Bacillus siamensis]|nr:hypothetical protein [Bacillus siamensis]